MAEDDQRLLQLQDTEESSQDEEDYAQSKENQSSPSCWSRTKRWTKKHPIATKISIVSFVIVAAVVIGIAIGEAARKSESKDSSNAIVKPETDRRSYRVVALSNELRALLISDPETDYGAAALTVNVGSMSDPPDVLGLAHFCEHMLFLGTTKYPGEDDYSGYLSENGGYDNAYTAQEVTNYHFKIEWGALSGALDRFSQFFISPLFTASSTGREMNAVASEHGKNINNDEWRLWQMIKTVANPKSPFHKFSTGNIETLNVSGIHDRLLAFHAAHYSANQMQLVVLGRHDLHDLEKWITKYFSLIPNTNAEAPRFSVQPFPADYVAKRVWIELLSDGHLLQLRWSLSPSDAIGDYLGSFLGDEGPGSIISVLRGRKWATKLSAGSEASTRLFLLYTISITLTDDGLANANEIVRYVFRYVNLMKANVVDKSLWDERILVDDINFRYRSYSDPDRYVTSIASTMQTVANPAGFLLAPSLRVYDADRLREALGVLTPENLVLFIASSSNSRAGSWPDLDQTEKWYGTKYHYESIPSNLLESWNDVNDPNGLSLPTRNRFIPTNFTLLPEPSSRAAAESPQLMSPPGKTLFSSLWWKHDAEFRLPRMNLYFSFATPLAYRDPFHSAVAHLYEYVIKNLLYEPLYSATLASFAYSVDMTYTGFTVELSGYSDEAIMSNFVRDVFTRFANLGRLNTTSLDNLGRYDLSLDQLKLYYANYPMSQQPYLTAYDYSNVVLEKIRWPVLEGEKTLGNITKEAFIAFAKDILSTASVTCLAHGNVNKVQALGYVRLVESILKGELRSSPPVVPPPQRLQIPANSSYILRMKGLDPANVNSAIRVVYQIGQACFSGKRQAVCSSEKLRLTVLLALLELKIKNPCFDQLRTKEQLGYIVACRTHRFENVLSFQVIIQSATYDADYLRRRSDAFVDSFTTTIESLGRNETEYRQLEQSAIDQLTARRISLQEASDAYWDEITSGENLFNRSAQIAASIRSGIDRTGPGDLVDFYRNYVASGGRQRRRLVVELYGAGRSFPGADPPGSIVLTTSDVAEFKRTAEAYEHP